MSLPRDEEERRRNILHIELRLAEIPDKIENTVAGVESGDTEHKFGDGEEQRLLVRGHASDHPDLVMNLFQYAIVGLQT